MTASFNIKFQSHHDKDVLKNRYKHLRRLYNEIKNLLDNSGFSWDETREMITTKDHIWDAYIKAHPDARSYRVKTVPGYQKLCVIIGQRKFWWKIQPFGSMHRC
ncbi:MYB/SANT-LIKE DNA-BINDING DOMAIN PROTEIN [Salix purpurea]|uniref:MYB/SANT-LIKE DNA-BINDING DOMAIN PROTEIN n=1 Tax=Salix purpurea TaxID=77065 RepID=A0A9Q0Q0D5_SALPP|nr:MYB/SANT-LIKE DNA-BINDING DOMAIN PROTEIN [Salix purpurea]